MSSLSNPLGRTGLEELERELDANAQQTESSSAQIHLRLFKRSTRKSITVAENLPSAWNLEKLLQALKRQYSCNGTLKTDAENGQRVLQLSGDQRQNIIAFALEKSLCERDAFTIHGY